MPTIVSTATKFSSISPRTVRDRMTTRDRSKRFKCSSGLLPDPSQITRNTGSTTQRITVTAKAFEDQPPHFRYQLKANTTATTQAVNTVTANQSMGRLTGLGGR